ncbi:MAG: hypothetical protein A3H98_00285 [Bacteroidetes bacterium RIFCSPLOWO2_02_FULL_36_8]|nr:MAG: hypothetical protein A3H98_00285 [Bacteroidetes bacterium RIFCSPLOWO2_02_FULL_36_8]OFY70829.1 MAG: hypothetical protein A3G23_11950 [Bacteroidetes bacterium RIFCSPLOWO2_12_FULL_37_12]
MANSKFINKSKTFQVILRRLNKPFQVVLRRNSWQNLKGFTCCIIATVYCLLLSCSAERNNIFSKSYHNTTAHYNCYFLARENLKASEKTVHEKNVDNYEKILKVYPTVELSTVNEISAQLDDVIKKSSMAIQRHKNSKWVDDCYILVGKSRFYKQDYLSALESFQYVNGTSKHKPTRVDAMILTLRSYTAMSNTRDALTTIDFISKDTLTKKNKRDFLLARGEFELFHEQYPSARKSLEDALPLIRKKALKTRVHFIVAQLYASEMNDEKAYYHFQKSLKGNKSYEMSFNAKISLIQVFGKSNDQSDREVRRFFKKLLNDGRNLDFRDKIYFQMAQYSYKKGDYPEAVKNLEKSIESSTTNTKQKALSCKALGDLYFDTYKNYSNANKYYDSTLTYLPKDHPEYERLKSKKMVLSELVENLEIMAREDSLQRLAKMPKEELDKLINKMIEEENEKRAEEQEMPTSQVYNPGEFNQQLNRDMKAGGDWYFYNPSVIGIGRSEFIKKWGNRKNEDGWRRGNKESEEENEVKSADQKGAKDEKEKENKNKSAKVYSKTELMKDIPLTPNELKTSNEKIQIAQYKVATIYKTRLANPNKAIQLFEELLSRFPETENKEEIYYNLYILYKEVKDDNYKKYEKLLLENFPETIYAKLVLNPSYLADEKKKEMELYSVYKRAYTSYQNEEYDLAKSDVKTILKGNSEHPLIDHFAFLKPLIIGRTQEKEKYKTALEEFIEKYPKSELTPHAQELLQRANNFDPNVPFDLVTGGEPNAPVFRFSPESPHFVLVVSPTSNPVTSAFKEFFDNFNNKSFGMDSLNTQTAVLNLTQSMLIVKSFPNKAKGTEYILRVKSDAELNQNLTAAPASVFLISQENFPVLYKTKDLPAYEQFFKRLYPELGNK